MEGSLKGYLGLGSNEGDRLANLRAARAALAGRGVEVISSSRVYETAPQGEVTDQPDFLNACVEIGTLLDPEELLGAGKAIERELGRATGGPPRARPIDVDVLLLGGLEHTSERLTLRTRGHDPPLRPRASAGAHPGCGCPTGASWPASWTGERTARDPPRGVSWR